MADYVTLNVLPTDKCQRLHKSDFDLWNAKIKLHCQQVIQGI